MLLKKLFSKRIIALALGMSIGCGSGSSSYNPEATPFKTQEYIHTYQPPQYYTPYNLDVINTSFLSPEEQVLIASLQGLSARKEPSMIWITPFGPEGWLNYLSDNHGITISYNDDIDWHLKKHLSSISGYIIYDKHRKESLYAAVSLAGIKNAIVVERSLEEKLSETIKKLERFDASELDNKWVLENVDCNDRYLIEIEPSLLHFITDFAVYENICVFHSGEGSPQFSREVFSSSRPGRLVLGWRGNNSEYEWVRDASINSLLAIPSNTISNLSVLNQINTNDLVQPNHHFVTIPRDSKAVAIYLSDGDNLGLFSRNFLTEEFFLHKTDFPINWEVPPIIALLAPTLIEYYYKNAGPNDFFIGASTCQAYTFQSMFSYKTEYAEDCSRLLRSLDLEVVSVIDEPDIKIADHLANITSGVLFKGGEYYSELAGAVRYIGSTPIIGASSIWSGHKTAEELAAEINRSPVGSHTNVVVHAVDEEDVMEKIQKFVSMLDQDVVIMSGRELFDDISRKTQSL
ncbi:MAG: GxGYxYP domain-containing protein [Nanoarchaeota archaeon]